MEIGGEDRIGINVDENRVSREDICIHRDVGSVLVIIQSLDFIKTKSGDEGSIMLRFLYSWPLNMEGERQKRATAAHSLSAIEQMPRWRPVTYRSCMPRISVHHYGSLETWPRRRSSPSDNATRLSNIRLFTWPCLPAVTSPRIT